MKVRSVERIQWYLLIVLHCSLDYQWRSLEYRGIPWGRKGGGDADLYPPSHVPEIILHPQSLSEAFHTLKY